jgi:aspartyl-tRNA(Asn)/glutamyl-tRNA(Gln) amidotransferase subunit A
MPAAYCGIVGLKPTYGLVSIRGIIPRTYSLDHCGPVTTTAEDCTVLLNGMVGYDKYDVASVDHPKQDYLARGKQPVDNFRLGIPRAPFYDFLDQDTSKAVEEAIAVHSKLTRRTKNIHLPAPGTYSRSYCDGEIHRVVDYINAQWELQRLRKTIDDAFENYDLAVLPTMRVIPETINEALAREEASGGNDREPVETSNCPPFNTVGILAVSIPCGFSANGLPVGLMIAGPRFSEGRVLALANKQLDGTCAGQVSRPTWLFLPSPQAQFRRPSAVLTGVND